MEPFRSLLLKTGSRKLVHIPMRGKTDFWTGRIEKGSGKLIGENNMGKLLVKVRNELRSAENISSSEKEGSVFTIDKSKGKKKDDENVLSLKGEYDVEKNDVVLPKKEHVYTLKKRKRDAEERARLPANRPIRKKPTLLFKTGFS